MSISSSGSSRLIARPMVSDLRSTPGPLVVVTPRWPPKAAPGGRRPRADPARRLDGQARQRNLVDREGLEGVVPQWVLRVPGLGQVAFLEGVDVDDQRATAREITEVGLERRGVHGHEDVRGIARGGDLVVGNVDLE